MDQVARVSTSSRKACLSVRIAGWCWRGVLAKSVNAASFPQQEINNTRPSSAALGRCCLCASSDSSPPIVDASYRRRRCKYINRKLSTRRVFPVPDNPSNNNTLFVRKEIVSFNVSRNNRCSSSRPKNLTCTNRKR